MEGGSPQTPGLVFDATAELGTQEVEALVEEMTEGFRKVAGGVLGSIRTAYGDSLNALLDAIRKDLLAALKARQASPW